MKKYIAVLFLIAFIVPSVAFASWWNPFTWNIFSIFNRQKTSQETQVKPQNLPVVQNIPPVQPKTINPTPTIKPPVKETPVTKPVVVTPVVTPKVITYDNFTTCLKEKGAVMYGAFWCSHCQAQKKLFGTSEKLLPYVECSTADGKAQTQVCQDKNIEGYPTWIFADGFRQASEMSFNDLSTKTSCALPNN